VDEGGGEGRRELRQRARAMILRGFRGRAPGNAERKRARGEEVTSSKAAVHKTPIEGWRGGGGVLDEWQR